MSSGEQLARYSAKWGSDFSLVQGAGGNTSLKVGDRMLVKASGFRLAEADQRRIFVDVARDDGLEMLNGAPAPVDSSGLRASIETSLHAVLPQPVIAHFHMIALLAVAVRVDADAVLTDKLAGLRWGFVPYIQPGVGVARAVADLLEERRELDIVVLGNHGIVFCGDTFEQVDASLAEVRRRLNSPARPVSPPDLERLAKLAADLRLEPARVTAAHGAALDAAALEFATAGTLYPDHVVFLGRGAAALKDGQAPVAETLLSLVPGAGALLAPGLSDEAHEMAACLAGVARRIAIGAELRVLSRQEEDALTNWDAEIYRRSLAQPRN